MTRRNGPTYLATREHPRYGLLLKIGTSNNPDKRCSSLGAKRFGPLLAHDCEQELHSLLAERRVWARMTWEVWFSEARPVFAASSEWYYADAEARAILRAYLQQAERVAA